MNAHGVTVRLSAALEGLRPRLASLGGTLRPSADGDALRDAVRLARLQADVDRLGRQQETIRAAVCEAIGQIDAGDLEAALRVLAALVAEGRHSDAG